MKNHHVIRYQQKSVNLEYKIMNKLRKEKLNLESVLADLPYYEAVVSWSHQGTDAMKIFAENPLLPGIIIMNNQKCEGMISRREFFECMSKPYSLDLFTKRSIEVLYKFIDKDCLILPGNTPIVTAMGKSLERHKKYEDTRLGLADDPIVFEKEPGYFYLLDNHDLLLASSYIYQLAIQELQRSKNELFKEKEMAQITLNSIGDGVITTDAFGQVQSLNPIAEKLTGWENKEAQGRSINQIFQIYHENSKELTINPIENVLKSGNSLGLNNENILVNRQGHEIAIADSAAPIMTKNGEILGAVMVFYDVTLERRMAQKLSWQANHDELTGLLNRRAFYQELEHSLFNAKLTNKTHTLCYLDLDKFKIVNDTCGHIAGDVLLKQVTEIFQKTVRKTDVICRLGGDEFAILLHQCSLEKGKIIAENMRSKIQEYNFIWGEKKFNIGVSIGLTLITPNIEDKQQLLNKADAACYAAKNKGRNRVYVYQDEDSDLIKQKGETQWVEKLNTALRENHFLLYYQTLKPIQKKSICGEHYEVLLRLRDNEGNMILPGAFIPAAERYNLMPLIDRWVIKTLFKHLGKHEQTLWNNCLNDHNKCDCLYTINLSGASINDEKLIDFIYEQLKLYTVYPKVICFEITETVAIANLHKANKFMQEMKTLGFRFALDDFGSGMSSFSYLKNLPIDYLKIDGSLIKDIVDDPVSCAMVEAINNIAQVMSIETVGEYTENELILEKLTHLGINYAQGYFINQPSPLTAVLGYAIA